MIRVMIADDSSTVRRYLENWVGSSPGFTLAASAAEGPQAVVLFREKRPDAVVLDVEMPGMNGIEVLREIRRMDCQVPVVMFSSATQTGSRETVAALLEGASDYVPKPYSKSLVEVAKDSLISKLRELSLRSRMPARISYGTEAHLSMGHWHGGRPEIIVIASSAGGPFALMELLTSIGEQQVPILAVQHMTGSFLGTLAGQLTDHLGRLVQVAEGGEFVEEGRIFLAPAGRHLVVEEGRSGLVTQLLDTPPVNSCKPAADVLFSSVAYLGHRSLGIVLSGMGTDGLEGSARIVAGGGLVFAQDASSSPVWGMPGAVVNAGLAAFVGDPRQIGLRLSGDPRSSAHR